MEGRDYQSFKARLMTCMPKEHHYSIAIVILLSEHRAGLARQ